jgi:hypothetical protein
MERKVVIKTISNPGVYTLTTNLERIRLLRLIYFRLSNVDPLDIPAFLFIKISGPSSFEANQTISSNFPRFTSECAPLYFKTDFSNTVLHGKQDHISWVVSNQKSANFIAGGIEIYDDKGTLFDFVNPNPLELYLVFEAVFDQPNYLDTNWFKDKSVLNSLNG